MSTGSGQPAIHVGQAPACAHRSQGGTETTTVRRCEVHVVGRHRRQVVIMGQADESVVEIGVGRQSMIDQLDHDMITAELCRQPVQLGGCRCPAGSDQCLPYGALAAAGVAADGDVIEEDDAVGVTTGGDRPPAPPAPPPDSWDVPSHRPSAGLR